MAVEKPACLITSATVISDRGSGCFADLRKSPDLLPALAVHTPHTIPIIVPTS